MSNERGIITTFTSGVNVVFEWKIGKFFNLPETDGAGYYSPEFLFGGEEWFLTIYPNGSRRNDSSGHVDLGLCKFDSDRSIKLSFSLSLKTAKREKYNERHFSKDFDDDDDFQIFNRFISRSELSGRRSELMSEGDLTVVCTMKSSTSAGSDMELLEAKSEIYALKLNYNQALQDKAEAQTKLRVLTNNFEDKEVQLQRQLSAKEDDRQKKEDDFNSAKRRIMLIEQENASYQSQIAVLKQEMEEEERTLKSRIAAQEKKADEIRIAAERNLENMEQEVTQLRQRLTLLEREHENCANAARDEIIRPDPKTCVEACTQTQKNVLRQAYTQTQKNVLRQACTQTQKHVLRQASTQTAKEKSEKCLEQNFENTCVEAYTQTKEENTDEWFKEKSRNACVDASIQTEEQNEEIKELDRSDTSEAAGSHETEVFSSNRTATKTNKSLSLISLPAERDLETDVKDLMKEGMKEGRGIDVTFEVDTPNAKTEFFAHQLILALRSPYFADLFYGQGKNKEHQIIPLKGINTEAFGQMIRHCYDYKPCLRTTEDACALFKVAFEFKVISLQNLCHAFIRQTNIEPGSVFSILKISEEMGDKSLEDMCYKILQGKTREVVAAYELCDVTPAMVYTLLNLPKLSLNSEYELIKWLFDWAKVKSEELSSKNAREYLEKFLKYMNLLALRFEEFAMLCKDNQEFFNPDEIGNISMNIAFPGTRDMPDWYGQDLKCRVYTGSKE